jgi:1-deoxy-D-xylulose-5-phosphate synthase
MQPKDEAEFVNMLYTMNTINDSPSLIRYPRGCGRGVKLPETPEILPIGKAEVISDGHDVVLISLGSLFDIAEEAQKQLEAEGISTALINARFIKPLDADCFRSFAKQARVVITIEDHSIQGGFGSAVIEDLQTAGITTPVERVGWPDQFIEHGTVPLLRQKYGLTAERIISLAKKHLSPLQDK